MTAGQSRDVRPSQNSPEWENCELAFRDEPLDDLRFSTSSPGGEDWGDLGFESLAERPEAAGQPRGARPGLPAFGGPGFAGGGPLGYRVIWFPDTPVAVQGGRFSIVGQDLNLAFPLGKDSGGKGTWLATGGVQQRTIVTGAVLPQSDRPYPEELWSVRLGTMYFRSLDNGWTVGGGTAIGSASDHPFASLAEMNVSVQAMMRMPQGDRNAWMFFLIYMPTGELAFPLPGVAFHYNPSDEFNAWIGLPFRITWRPTAQWLLEASYMPIHVIHAKARYRICETVSAFAGYDWSSEAYSLRDREASRDRLFLYDQRLAAGVEWGLSALLTATISAGYSFDRFTFEGRQWDTTGTNRIDLGDGPFGSLGLGLRF